MSLNNTPHPEFSTDPHFENRLGYETNKNDWGILLSSEANAAHASVMGYQKAASYFSDDHATSLKILKQLADRGMKPLRPPLVNGEYSAGFHDGVHHALVAIAPHWSTLIAGLGLTGEAGEVADILKKHYGHSLDHPLNKGGKFIKELGDVSWYLSYLATAFRQSLASVFAGNIAKLHERYKSGFNGESSLNRVENQTVPSSGLSDADVQRIAKALAQELKT